MSAKEVTDMLSKKSGLLGISELSNDMRTIQEAAADGHEGAKLALEITAYRLAKYIASMSVAHRPPGCSGVHRRHRRKLQPDSRQNHRLSGHTRLRA